MSKVRVYANKIMFTYYTSQQQFVINIDRHEVSGAVDVPKKNWKDFFHDITVEVEGIAEYPNEGE